MSGFFYIFTGMKAKELIYNLKQNLEGVNSEVAKRNDHHLMWMLDEARANLASRKMDKSVNVELMTQFLDVKPQNADKKIYGDIGDADVKKLVIPKPINYNGGTGIFTVGSSDGTQSFTRISFSQIRTALAGKYTASTPKWFYLNEEIYLINLDYESSQSVRVRGIFDEPWRVIQAKGDFKYLDPWNFEYPLSTKDAKSVYQLALTGDMGWGDTVAAAIAEQERDRQQDAKVQ